jgi:hypothetical protein
MFFRKKIDAGKSTPSISAENRARGRAVQRAITCRLPAASRANRAQGFPSLPSPDLIRGSASTWFSLRPIRTHPAPEGLHDRDEPDHDGGPSTDIYRRQIEVLFDAPHSHF